MNRYRYIVALNHRRCLAERDARPVQGILTGIGLGLAFWTVLGLLAALA